MTVGFDFGTTNSLVSVVSGDRVIDLLGEGNLPYPSVVRYEGEAVIVGHEAREALDTAGLGVHGNTVRSPKFFLGEEFIDVAGVDKSPVDIVADIVRYVRAESLRNSRRVDLRGLDNAVVTIPVTMNGPRRAALRQAFGQAGIGVSQFVHEPFAALYGYIRGSSDVGDILRDLRGRTVLVVDWGGGTLDLTLCTVGRDRVLQIASGGTATVGGDHFDEAIRNAVEQRFAAETDLAADDRPSKAARLRALKRAEDNKKELSSQPKASFYQPGYFGASGTDLVYALTRTELESITRPLIDEAMLEIDSLLERSGTGAAQVSRCIVVGGMAAMPAIRGRLIEKFGHVRVEVPENSATLVSQGAAWIAHDRQDLVLAKPIELELARGDYLPLLKAGTPMPSHGQVRAERFSLYCADPTDGKAKFPVVSPKHLVDFPQSTTQRETLGMLTLDVDTKARPLLERLHLDVEIDENLILEVRAESTQAGTMERGRFFDLEFGLALPSGDGAASVDADVLDQRVEESTGLTIRANVTSIEGKSAEQQQATIPGDVLYRSRREAFSPPPIKNRATELQRVEHLYYQPCAVCKRAWGDPDCTCAA
ncbi:Hsp70 family protein [Lysobacter korlensis]|uniref:Hsp70 family protein n=1 Tax=Lysobacter korlensis TaxID=553636 RepID=A0ABV6RXQ8_9GAMM